MPTFWAKQGSSRPIRLLELDYTGSGTQATTTLLSETQQVRVFTDVRGYLSFGSTAITTASRVGATVEIGPNIVGEYFTVNPGQQISFSSSSTSSGSVLITEMS